MKKSIKFIIETLISTLNSKFYILSDKSIFLFICVLFHNCKLKSSNYVFSFLELLYFKCNLPTSIKLFLLKFPIIKWSLHTKK